MQISTTRFGLLSVDVDDLLHFPTGVAGFEDCRHWVLLADPEQQRGWLAAECRAARHGIGRGQSAPLRRTTTGSA